MTAAGHPSLSKLEAAGFELAFPAAGQQPTEEDLLRLLPGCVGYLAGVEKVSAQVLEAARDLKVISRNGVGVENVDLVAAQRLGVVVCKASGSNSRGVAELAMAHILSLARWVPWSDKYLKADGWERRKGIELMGRTLGLIGCGNIGRLVARFALGMDMKVLAYDVMPDHSFAPSVDFRYAALEEVLTNSEIISLHCPALTGGKPLLDATALGKLKRGVFIVNTARADLIDAAALTAAIQSGQVAGVAIDVFRTEPPTGDPLVSNDRIVATPHIGGFTYESVDRAVQMAVDNLLAELECETHPA